MKTRIRKKVECTTCNKNLNYNSSILKNRLLVNGVKSSTLQTRELLDIVVSVQKINRAKKTLNYLKTVHNRTLALSYRAYLLQKLQQIECKDRKEWFSSNLYQNGRCDQAVTSHVILCDVEV